MATHVSVRALLRGLDLLAAVGRHGGNAERLSAAVGLNRTTVYRLLQTLEEAGYLARSPSDHGYRLTIKVRSISDGFKDSAWVSQVGAPVLGDLLREIVWPSDLATFDRDAMVVRESTHRFSPFSIHAGMVGRRLPMSSALGGAYVAFSAAPTRGRVLEVLRSSPDPVNSWASDGKAILAMVRRATTVGYAESVGDADSKIAAIAVPIRHRGLVLACLNVIVLRTAMPVEEISRRYLLALRRAAARIEAGLDAQDLAIPETLDG